jgi:uncharacterized membrane protein YfcA
MASYLRGLAYFLLIVGVILCVVCGYWAYGDEAYFKAAELYSRHQDSLPFVVEYYATMSRHLSFIVTGLLAGIFGVVSSAILFALSIVLKRVEHLERSPYAR